MCGVGLFIASSLHQLRLRKYNCPTTQHTITDVYVCVRAQLSHHKTHYHQCLCACDRADRSPLHVSASAAKSMALFDHLQRKLDPGERRRIGDALAQCAAGLGLRMQIVGSTRRGVQSSKDLDVLLCHETDETATTRQIMHRFIAALGYQGSTFTNTDFLL